jgi:hypothetical protein
MTVDEQPKQAKDNEANEPDKNKVTNETYETYEPTQSNQAIEAEQALIPIGKILLYPVEQGEQTHIKVKCSRIERQGRRICYQFDWQDPEADFDWSPVFEVRSSEALLRFFGTQVASKMIDVKWIDS